MSARDRSGGLGRVGPIRAEGRARDAQGAEVTTHQLTAPERAAWRVAVRRGLPIAAADVRELLSAARAAEALESGHQGAEADGPRPLADNPLPCPDGCEHPLTVHSADLGCWLCDCTHGREVAR